MIRLAKSEVFKIKMRQDDPADLAKPTWDVVDEAIKSNNLDEALEFIEYGLSESLRTHPL